MKIAIVVGTRPEIIKMSPIIHECNRRNLKYDIIHTQQHYSNNMDKVFFDNLELEYPKITLNIGSDEVGLQIARIIEKSYSVFKKNSYDVVLVQGDTNTVMGAALAAQKLGVKVGHVEAGLRSYDKSMPEEINRIVTDAISDYAFCPTTRSKEFILKESIDKNRVFVVGNTIVDALIRAKNRISKNILNDNYLVEENYFLATIHRPANVDNIEILENILETFKLIVKKYNIPIVFPMHPRTKKNLEKSKIELPDEIKIIEPIGYFDFLSLQIYSKIIFTDSGGIQEEACVLKRPCITLRDNTERPETIDVGANLLTGLKRKKILDAVEYWLRKEQYNWVNPFGDGRTAQKIVDIISK